MANVQNSVKFVLASASPARRRLLENVGIQAVVLPSDFDESLVTTNEPHDLVKLLAQCKAEAVANFLKNSPENQQSTLVLGCDSVLVIRDEIHGKPANGEEAIARWEIMRGQVGQLYTGHALIDLGQNKTLVYCQVTQVYFAQVSDEEIEAYVNTGEPLNCAGCFAIEGKGGLFVEKLEGCHTNVIGLSLPLLRRMLLELGYSVTQFWDSNS